MKNIIKFFLKIKFIELILLNIYKAAEVGIWKYINLHLMLCYCFLLSKLNTKYYQFLSKKKLLLLKKTDTIFIFGSGFSLNHISEKEWLHFSKYDTMGFNHFVRQNWIRSDFHLVRGWREGVINRNLGSSASLEFVSLIRNKLHYENTTYIIQNDYSAFVGNSMIGRRYLPKNSKIFQYKSIKESYPPNKNSQFQLHHGVGTLCDAVSFAYYMGWKKIVLVGVDLYDSRYFWLKENETFFTNYSSGEQVASDISDRGQRYDQIHSTLSSGIKEIMDQWNLEFMKHGVEILTYNPKSLLNGILNVYKP